MADPVTIDTAGHWLSPDAAASYAQMRAAGLPAGGVTSAGRTAAEQAELHAKDPGVATTVDKSPHVKGQALDVSTSSSAQTWLLANGAKYGWTRPLANEPWHWLFGGTASSGGVTQTVGNVVSNARDLLSDPLGLSAIGTDLRNVGIQIVFVLFGLGLVTLGVQKLVVPQITKAVGEVL